MENSAINNEQAVELAAAEVKALDIIKDSMTMAGDFDSLHRGDKPTPIPDLFEISQGISIVEKDPIVKHVKTLLYDRMLCLIEKDAADDSGDKMTKGGIILTASAAARHRPPFKFARVLATGPGIIDMEGQLMPMTCKSGDRIAIEMGGYMKFSYRDQDYCLIDEKNCIMVVSENFLLESELMSHEQNPMDLSKIGCQ